VTDDLRCIRVDEFLPHPPEKVWRALTDPEMIGRWLMPNDFKLEVGHRFTFQGTPIPAAGFGGTGHSEVLAFEEGTMLRIAWRAAPDDPSTLDSTVTFTLVPEGTGTRLFLVHEGFDPDNPYQLASRRMMGGGWAGVVRHLGAVIGTPRSGDAAVRAKISRHFPVEPLLPG
jgi:uncharacterized protein YndB with AHSA1/START domain